MNNTNFLFLSFFRFQLLIILSLFCNNGLAEKKIALVIGNAEYHNSPLANPENDAFDMGNALKKLGFEVDSRTNLDRKNMRQAIRGFGEKLKYADVGLFYYAGHGIQINGSNYLIPVKVDVSSADEVQDESIDASSILRKMQTAGNNTNIIILDACRNNPFARSFRNLNQGLAKMDGPVGSFIAYATSPGSVAADGSGRNGIYTHYLLEALNQPGIAIEKTFKIVRNAVMDATDGKQIPWESSSLMGEFIFLTDNKASKPITKPQAPIVKSKYLQVITNVPNAKVLINNVERGIANSNGILNIENIMEDHVEVLVQADGYNVERKKVTLTPNQWEQLNLKLTPSKTRPIESNDRLINSSACIKNEKVILNTNVEFHSENGKQVIKRDLPEIKLLLMESLRKYHLEFVDLDLPNSKSKKQKKYRTAYLNAIKRFKPKYLIRFSSVVNKNAIKTIKTNMKTIEGDLSLELINLKNKNISAFATKSFRKAGLNSKAILRSVLKKELDDLTNNMIKQICS